MPFQVQGVTDTEFSILNVLWQFGPTTVRGIVEAVYGKHTHTLHTSVKSLLQRLIKRDLVVSTRAGGVHLFSAAMTRKSFVTEQLQLLANKHFGGSLTLLLGVFLDGITLGRNDRRVVREILERISSTT